MSTTSQLNVQRYKRFYLLAHINYALLLLGLPFIAPFVLAYAIARTVKPQVRGTVLSSHASYQQRTALIAIVLYGLGFLLFYYFSFTSFLMIFVVFYLLYRIGSGWLILRDGDTVYNSIKAKEKQQKESAKQ